MTQTEILYTLGLNSNTKDGKHIIMCDFDIDDINKVKGDLLKCQKYFTLSTFYIVKSNNGFNAFCLDKVTIEKLREIYNNMEYVDPLFIKMTFKRGYSTIRIGDDKKYIDKVTQYYIIHKRSKAHLFALQEYFNIKDIKFNQLYDDFLEVDLCQYENKKYGQPLPFKNIELKKYLR